MLPEAALRIAEALIFAADRPVTTARLAQALGIGGDEKDSLDPAAILPNLHHAYRRPEFARSRYTVFHTGPSATADIEGVLIHGAQGVRSLSVLLLPPPG